MGEARADPERRIPGLSPGTTADPACGEYDGSPAGLDRSIHGGRVHEEGTRRSPRLVGKAMAPERRRERASGSLTAPTRSLELRSRRVRRGGMRNAAGTLACSRGSRTSGVLVFKA